MIKLDKEQTKTASHFGHNALVLAGAGSGKTATLTARGAHLVKNGVNPLGMCMFTFTNKAAKEMRERMIGIFIDESINKDIPMITTFHQFGYKLIKRYAKECLRPEGQPSIMNEKEAEQEWIEALKTGEIYSKEKYKEDNFYKSLPELLGNEGIFLMDDETSFREFYQLLDEHGKSSEYEKLGNAVIAYTESKMKQNLLDFNDMILLPIYLLKTKPEIRNKIQDYLVDVAVDESQDNNKAQYKLLKLLTDTGRKVPVMMVGDDDQGIYGWRGAMSSGLQKFLDEFNAEMYLLEKNYRSKSDIVEKAGRVVSNNKTRIEKNPYAVRESDKPIDLHGLEGQIESDSVFYGESENAIELGEKLAKLIKSKQKAGMPLNEIAILYRTQRMGFFMDKALSSHGIATNVLTGTGLTERKEVLMAIAALRLCANPFDRRAFKRISGIIEGLGGKSVEKICEASEAQKQPLKPGKIQGLAPKQQAQIMQLNEILKPLMAGPETLSEWTKSPALINWLRREFKSKVKTEVNAGKIEDNEERKEARISNLVIDALDNIDIIAKSILNELSTGQYKDNKWEVITELSLDAPQSKKDKVGVKLSTIHSFKGLECKEVHVAGFTDGLMPKHTNNIIEDPEEERRLAYVAMTRPEDRLYLHHVANWDNIMGGIGFDAKKMKRSIYLKEMRPSGMDFHEDKESEHQAEIRNNLSDKGKQFLDSFGI